MIVKYPELRKLMAANQMTMTDISIITGKTKAAISEKLSGETDFKLREVKAITEYFKKLRPELNSDIIFSDIEVLTKVNACEA